MVQFVCGCDGKNYHSECLARLAGVNLFAEGGCPGKVCSSSLDCTRDQYCRKPTAPSSCSESATGVCDKRPFKCLVGANRNVCGCNGLNYEDPCIAAIDRVSVYASGLCNATIPANCSAPVNNAKSCTTKCAGKGQIVDDFAPFDPVTQCPNQCKCKVQPVCPRSFKGAKACRRFCRKQRLLGVFTKVDPETFCKGVCTCVASTR